LIAPAAELGLELASARGKAAMTYEQQVVDWLRERLDKPDAATSAELSKMLRALTIWRSRAIAAKFIRDNGATIMAGPFKGMDYVSAATEGALAPRLLGTYEAELHSSLRRFAREGLDCVIDVGCAEGYYAIGLARLMPAVTVYAYDVDAAALQACAELAARNGVADRVHVAGAFSPEMFQAFADRRCLVLMDVEGAEDDLLRPDLAPALAGMRIIVETHDVLRPGNLQRLVERFAATHDIERINPVGKSVDLSRLMPGASTFDMLLATWEWRLSTPWLVMTPRAATLGAGR
jgi:precorrin-6B methylase 2